MASGNFSTNTFTFNWLSVNIKVNPWESLKVYLEWTNNTTSVINNVYGKVIFDYNSDITYAWDLRVMNKSEQIVLTNEYDKISWLNALITRWTDTPVKIWEYPCYIRIQIQLDLVLKLQQKLY